MKQTNPHKLLITATTFPRWKNDTVPSFVKNYAIRVSKHLDRVDVLAPHFKGAPTKEVMDGLNVKRFRYAFPASAENIIYAEHGVKGIKKSPIYALKLLGFLISQSFSIVFSKSTDIINAHWLIPQGFLAVLLRPVHRRKVVITVHGSDVFALNARPIRAVKRWTLKKADAVVVNSSSTMNACLELNPGGHFQIIPPGVDTEEFKPAHKKNSDKFEILFVGRLSSEKGIQHLLKSIQYIPGNLRKKIQIRIIGDGSEKPKIERIIKEEQLDNQVMMQGWVQHEDLPKYYQQADVLVAPTIHDTDGIREAFGLVLAEALACGLPVIATDSGALSDIVTDGKTGFKIPQKSPKAIAKHVTQLVEDPNLLDSMRQTGRDHIVENFSWDVSINKYMTIFRDLLSS